MDYKLEEFITIIVPSRAVDALLELCIKKTRALYPLVPIIIVLNELSGADSISLRYSGITILNDAGNMSKKRNAAIGVCKTKYAMFMDSDAYMAERCLETAFVFLEKPKNANYALVTCLQYNALEDSFLQRCIRKLRQSPLCVHRDTITQSNPKQKDTDMIVASSAGMLINRKYFLDAGGFNEDIYIFEDTDLTTKLVKQGFRLRLLSGCVLFHRERTLIPFLKQRYCYTYSLVENFPTTKRLEDVIATITPFFMVFLLLTLLIFGIINFRVFETIVLAIFLLIFCESARLADYSPRAFAVIFYVFILLYLTWIFAGFCATTRIYGKNTLKKLYTHK